MSDDFDGEPIPGLPDRLPAGEEILWQGTPLFMATALRVFHARKVAVYFGALMAWNGTSAALAGRSALDSLQLALGLVPLALAALGLLALFAWFVVKTTIYTITTRRVVLRFGVALQMAVNVPMQSIDSAALKLFHDGSGNLPLQLHADQKVSYFVLWPHVRPWRFNPVEPMLRGVAEAEQVAAILARALKVAHGTATADQTAGPRIAGIKPPRNNTMASTVAA
jgi:hypothetical protein